MAYLRFQLDSKQEPAQFSELPPPQAVPAMAATVGPRFPPVEASSPPRAERVELRWPFVGSMFGLGGGSFLNPKEQKPRELGPGQPTLATLQANSSSAGL
eukprot:2378698-Amphidinium_carterae.1